MSQTRHDAVGGAVHEAYLEIGPDGVCLAQVLDLPGCFAVGPSQAEALRLLGQRLPPYYAWLARHDDYMPLVREPLRAEARAVERSREASPCAALAFFEPDARPVTNEDLDWYLALLQWAADDLLAAAGQRGSADGGDATLRHVAERQRGFLLGAGVMVAEATPMPPADGAAALRAVLAASVAAIRATDEDARAAVRERDSVRWSLRKALRASIVHALAHGDEPERGLG